MFVTHHTYYKGHSYSHSTCCGLVCVYLGEWPSGKMSGTWQLSNKVVQVKRRVVILSNNHYYHNI